VETHRKRHATLQEARHEADSKEQLLRSLPFEADGIVVKVDRLVLHQELGIVGGREPRWAIARKFAPEVVVTRLLDIGINVGRTGALNPYARLEPVEVSGVTVSNATLHNEDLIEQKDIRIGDWVEVMRAGEVIPQIIGPIPERRDGSEQPFKMPDKCPACGTPVERPPDEAMRYCPNATCPGRVLEGIVHFASRDAMDIRGLGYERVRQLLDAKLIQDVSDLYQLSAERLVELDRFANNRPTSWWLRSPHRATALSPSCYSALDPPCREERRPASREALRQHGSADERLGRSDQQRPRSRSDHRRSGRQLLCRAAQSLAHRAAAAGRAPDGRSRRRRNGRPVERQVLCVDRDLAHPEPPEGCEPHRTGRGARDRQREQED
jgi:DNA ligase (NAD+)